MKNKPRRIESTPPFIRALSRLTKKYPSVRQEVKTLIQQLEQGETPGDRVPNVGYLVFKVRLRGRDLVRGKSGGFRVIYYIQTEDSLLLVQIYVKTERSDLSPEQIRRIIEDYLKSQE